VSRVLLDTNVLSELVRPRPEARVKAFVRAQTDPLISVVTIHEISYGAERAPDAARRLKLVAWVAAIKSRFAGRIISVDAAIAEQAGRLRAAAEAQGMAADPIDSLIAASALSQSASVATRNVRDFAAFGLGIINPWA
jgi:toxin FitB